MSTQFNWQTFLFQPIQFSPTALIQPVQFSISIDFVYAQLFEIKVLVFNSVLPQIQFQCQKKFHFTQLSLA